MVSAYELVLRLSLLVHSFLDECVDTQWKSASILLVAEFLFPNAPTDHRTISIASFIVVRDYIYL